MDKTLVVLISEQHVPNLLSVHHFKPDSLVMLQTDEMARREAGARFLDALRLGGMDYSESHRSLAVPSADSPDEVYRLLSEVWGPGARWIVNLTGGTKPMSIGAWNFGVEKCADLAYSNVSEPGRIRYLRRQDPRSPVLEDMKHDLSIREFLTGYGFKVLKSQDAIDASHERARGWFETSRAIARENNGEDLLSLDEAERKRARSKGLRLETRHQTEWLRSRMDLQHSIAASFALAGGTLAGGLDKYQVEFLLGGWLEVFFWGLLQERSRDLGVRDVSLGLQVGPARTAVGDEGPPNELDVSFIRNFQLTTIECKSGGQDHDPQAEILYKIEAVMEGFRALRVGKCLATTARSLADAEGHLKDAVRRRARLYDCAVITAREIRVLAEQPTDELLLKAVSGRWR
ncbi:MAG: DUF1887 family protein [Actinobacteria bacterium]|nr:DUF1887 family protein [Actinomycetota bacterium]